jgi:tRNA(adenine34) deaminase
MSKLDLSEFEDEPWMFENGLCALGDEHFMRRALELANQAAVQDEVPVGAIVVHENKIIATAYNQREQLADPTAHAEMIAITQAASHLGSWRLLDCTLFVTLEPCPMCAGAILQSRIPRVVYGAVDSKAGAVISLYQLLSDVRLNHRCEVIGGVLAGQCGQVLTEFFERKRKLGKK